MGRKDIPIRYTSRDFESIRNDLVDHVKRYYPDSFKDFNEATFGAMMLDAVAYIGDILSFYTDYQANESFFETAIEYDNVIKQARQLGYKFNYSASSTGKVDLFITVPANDNGIGIDENYLPLLRKGTTMTAGANTFTLVEDVDFSDTDAIDVAVASVNSSTGVPENYAVRATGRVISGELNSVTSAVGDFKKFLKVEIADRNVTEIVSVMDSEGHEYMEVENLAQNVVYKAIKSQRSDKNLAPFLLKPYIASRRYTVERTRTSTIIQFGHGTDTEIKNPTVADPSDVVLDVNGRDYVSDPSFDPARLNKTDKFGIAPSNTTLSISYRVNSSDDVNASAGAINQVDNPIFQFNEDLDLDGDKTTTIINSIEVTNEDPIVGDVSAPTIEELKILAKNYFATQNRAVTKQDYVSIAYAMPSKFGSIKRVSVIQDTDSFKRNLNLYVLAEDTAGALTLATDTIKENLKTWLNNYKMVNDTIDLLDANIVNIGINFSVIGERNVNVLDLLIECKRRLSELYTQKFNIGEPLNIAEIYQTLNRVEGVVDTTDVTVNQKTGTDYSNIFYDVEENLSTDGRMLLVPNDTILEIKFINSDITGQIIGTLNQDSSSSSTGTGAY
tara:strand:+ start:2012 stop:3856 length:1845 start_codon:yes stop_codon:yes gene_type:complete